MKKLFKYFNTLLIFSLVSMALFAQPKSWGESMDYELELFSVSASPASSGQVDLEFVFNNRLDPSSVDQSQVLINGKECLSSGKIIFSKDGSRFKITVRVSSRYFSLELRGVESQDGVEMLPVRIDQVEAGNTYTRRSDGRWERS